MGRLVGDTQLLSINSASRLCATPIRPSRQMDYGLRHSIDFIWAWQTACQHSAEQGFDLFLEGRVRIGLRGDRRCQQRQAKPQQAAGEIHALLAGKDESDPNLADIVTLKMEPGIVA